MNEVMTLEQVFDKAIETWNSGGWLMLPLAALSFFIYYTALELYVRLLLHPLFKKENQQPEKVNPFTADSHHLKKEVHKLSESYSLLRQRWLSKIKRRTKFLGIIITTGPLMGLLGTVIGILSMFHGMTNSQENRFDSVADGISKALITTQTGLIIAIPAYFILTLIIQKRKHLELKIRQIEQAHIKGLIQELRAEQN